MQVHTRAGMLVAVALASLPVCAGEAPPQGTGSGRVLLQPPATIVASPINDRFALRGLFYMPHIATSVRYDSTAGVPGTLVSGEDTLGLADELKQGSADMMFRIGPRHRIHADFYKMKRSGDVVLSDEVLFGDAVFEAGDRVLSSMDLRALGLTYTYSFLRREKWELGAGLALRLLQLQGTMEAPARFERESLDTAGPFLTFAVDATWRMSPRFSLNLAGNYMDGSIRDVAGGYQYLHGDVQFRARPNLAFGIGYSQTRYKAVSTDVEFSGYFHLDYQGPEAFVRVSF